MLDWTVRWGIPLALLLLAAVAADSRASDPSTMAQHAIETFRSAVVGLIPRFL